MTRCFTHKSKVPTLNVKVPWLRSRSQPGIQVIIRDLRGHLLHTVTFLVDIVNFPFLNDDRLVRHLIVFIFLKLFVLLEFPVMLMTLILVIKYGQQNFSNNNIDITNFVRRFLNLIGDILTSCLNIMSD